MLQEDLLRQLLTDSKAYGSLLGSGGVGDPGRLPTASLAFAKLLCIVGHHLHYHRLCALQACHGICRLRHLPNKLLSPALGAKHCGMSLKRNWLQTVLSLIQSALIHVPVEAHGFDMRATIITNQDGCLDNT